MFLGVVYGAAALAVRRGAVRPASARASTSTPSIRRSRPSRPPGSRHDEGASVPEAPSDPRSVRAGRTGHGGHRRLGGHHLPPSASHQQAHGSIWRVPVADLGRGASGSRLRPRNRDCRGHDTRWRLRPRPAARGPVPPLSAAEPAARAGRRVLPDVLGLAVLVEAARAELAADPRSLVAAPLGLRDVDVVVVDPDRPVAEASGDALGTPGVRGPDRPGQAVRRVVAEGDRLVLGREALDGQDRAEDLLRTIRIALVTSAKTVGR